MSSIYSKECLLPYFQNRVAEVKENLAQVKKLCNVEGVFYVESALNPSDLSTRAMATINELGPDSVHQTGPFFLSATECVANHTVLFFRRYSCE